VPFPAPPEGLLPSNSNRSSADADFWSSLGFVNACQAKAPLEIPTVGDLEYREMRGTQNICETAVMIVWLASYPRSGNTFFRMLLHKIFGLRTHTLYSVANDAELRREDTARLMRLIGQVELDCEVDMLRAEPGQHFVKTIFPTTTPRPLSW
jgi:hypothetical protein